MVKLESSMVQKLTTITNAEWNIVYFNRSATVFHTEMFSSYTQLKMQAN